MKAVQLVAHGAPGRHELRDLPDLQPAAGEVVLQVKACGVNHLDLWCEQGELPIPLHLPRTQGCEVAGSVLRVGEGVSGWQPGDCAAVPSGLYCGQCEYCQRGEEAMCLRGLMLGVQRDGGFADQVAVPAHTLARLPAGVSFETAAALALAGSTAMHILTDRVQVRRGDWVLVIGGASGVGSAAIQIARALGARVLSTGSTAAKRALGCRLGAEAAFDSGTRDWPNEVRKITGKRGVEVVVEHVGGAVLEQVFTCLARGGAVVTCGATAGRQVSLDLWPLFVKQHRLIGSYSRNRADLEATLAWAAAGRLQAVIDATYPLAQVPQALGRLRARAVLGKLLVQP